jgi:hypothetical protein
VTDRHDSGEKISPGFARRLADVASGERVRALVLLNRPARHTALKRRPTRAARQKTAVAIRTKANEALPEIDRILGRYKGRRLAQGVNGLGMVPVEAPPAAFRALAASRVVKAILEDQPIGLVAGR